MFYAISWFLVVLLLALWSLAVWAMHGLAVWTVTNAGALSGSASSVGALALPDWLAPWMPPGTAQVLSQLWASLWPAIESLLQVAPALAGGVMVVGWLVWGVGAVLLVLLGAGLHMGIAVWTRRRGRTSTRRWRAEVAG